MRHAILVEGHGNNAEVLQETIRILDDAEIDFWIHWDKRFKKPILTSYKSKLHFIKPIKNNWGADTQIIIEKKLLKAVSKKKYDYIHLISSSDIPLMTANYFKSYFKNEVYIGFFNSKNQISDRIRYYYPTRFLNLRKDPFKLKRVIFSIVVLLQKLLRIDRLKNSNYKIKKGSNWFSIKKKYIANILEFDDSIFMYSFLADELYIQTILGDFEDSIDNKDGNCRYIDWDRGRPYVFTEKDARELSNLINTKYSFARKVNNANIPRKIFQDL